MNKLKIALILFAATTMSFSSCDDTKSAEPQIQDCINGKVLKNVQNQSGTIHFNSVEKRYAVHVSKQGTYDTQDIGFLCNPPDSLKIEGTKITFDGDYYAYEKGRVAPIGGATYFFLNILKLKPGK